MAKKIIKAIPTCRIDTASNWYNFNPILESGEVAYELDTDNLPGKYKVGNGINTWNELPYYSRKKLIGSVSSSNFFSFAQTEINPGSYFAKFKIVVTSTVDSTLEHELFIEIMGNKNYSPIVTGWSRTNTTSASQTGIYYIRIVYPKTVNNGYRTLFDLWTYNSTKRDIYVELIESSGVSLTGSIATSLYNSSYQNITQTAVLYNGVIGNSTLYISASSAGVSTLSYNLYNATFLTADAVVANDLVFLNTSTNKWEKVANGKNIPLGTMLARVYSNYAANTTCGVILQGLWPAPAGASGLVNGKDVFLKGAIISGNFVADGTLTTTFEPGLTYMRLGSVINSQINYDQNNRVYTFSSSGYLSAIDSLAFPVSLPANGGNADTIVGKTIWTGSQASYDSLASKDSNTLYFIV